MNREDAIQALTAKGNTREQAEAFIELMGSAFRRRGVVAEQRRSESVQA